MEGEAKENDLRPISDRISGTIRRFLLDESRGGGVIGDWSVGGIAGGGSFEHKSDILSSKNFRKEAARVDAHEKEGKHDIWYLKPKVGISYTPCTSSIVQHGLDWF